ncbi:uncharacterized protein FA14DRAFT_172123 [Meira miltonrushii]|uniref:Uncharacterized protein n=1 Tax=Meira miltonrushii TaxID=1280837 RepID=A0A316VEI6_9BASI|nr:uncharacterized protein FA14DRAFT_172123 [Meira miltonrushii]PWN35488.1 hypothetical protein FA14DRAFT_172123 [Meira miltonrushii]
MTYRKFFVILLFCASTVGTCLSASTSTHSSSSGQSSSGKSVENRPYSESENAYSDTDSKESLSGRTVAPGTLNFHTGKYTLYNGKIAYHHELSNHLQAKEPKFAKEHEKEMESAHARKQKHANWSVAIAQENMQPGKKRKLPQPFPNPPNAKEAEKMRKDPTISWETEKGFNRLLAKKLLYEQKRPKREEESGSSSSSSP